MCSICGCEGSTFKIEAHAHRPESPPHHHPGQVGEKRLIKLETDLLAANRAHAEENRQLFRRKNVLCLNLVSGPGAGKTTLLARTIRDLKAGGALSVIQGDQQTSLDAEQMVAAGARALQINTGKGCHLDAHMVAHGVEHLGVDDGSTLFIENVGNLVCPTDFDLGEQRRVIILSVTEGADKPLKYANIFASAQLMIISKIDLLPHVRFDVEQSVEHARRVNPELEVLRLSAESGEGLDAWYAWLRHQRRPFDTRPLA